MKRALTILLLVLGLAALVPPARAFQLALTNAPLTGTYDASSYDTADLGYIFSGRYFRSYFDGMYPAVTNHFYSVSHSGATWEDQWTNHQEQDCLSVWATYTNLIWDFRLANDNGSYSSNTTSQFGADLDAAPGLFNNGAISTNEGGVAPTLTVHHFTLGRVPHDSADGDSGAIAGNAACTNLNFAEGVPLVDTWHWTWTNGWSTDVTGARLLGYYAGSHPFPAGQLLMTFCYLLNLNADTNVGSFVLNGQGASVSSTNHWTIPSVTWSGNTLTFTAHADRMPFAWDVPDGTVTNDARGCFTVYPALAQSFQWVLQVTNLPAGTYAVATDGSNILTLTAAQLAAGTNMFTLYKGWMWAQRRAVQFAIDDLYGVDHATLLNTHNAGSPGVLGFSDLINKESLSSSFWQAGNRGDALISSMAATMTAIANYDTAIHAAAVQTNHTFTITLIPPAGVTNLSVGTMWLGKMKYKGRLTNCWLESSADARHWAVDWNFTPSGADWIVSNTHGTRFYRVGGELP